ncbi:MAG: signal peptidase I [Anaerolineales bacterium]
MNESPFPEPQPPEWAPSGRPSFGQRFLGFMGELFQTVLVAGLLFLAVNLLTARIRVEGISMEPSLHEGQFVVVNRMAYRWSQPERGDIIVFHFPLNPERRFIKRVIGLPGEEVTVRAGQVYVNGELIDEPYLNAAPRYSGDWTLGSDEIFVLGDNRNNSSDSQNWGPLPLNEIIGKAVLVYWPPSEAGLIPHYDLAAAGE